MDKDLILMCEGGCVDHNVIFRQIHDDNDIEQFVYVYIHLDKLNFWERVRYVFTGKHKQGIGEYVETLTTKKKLQDIVNQLE